MRLYLMFVTAVCVLFMLESWGCGLYTSAAYTRVFTVLIKVFTGIWQMNYFKATGHSTDLDKTRKIINVIIITFLFIIMTVKNIWNEQSHLLTMFYLC